jgi:hypothetical protein
MRNQDEKLVGWDLPRDHFVTNISNFFEHLPDKIPEVKYPQSYQAMLGGTPGTMHMNKDGVEFVYFHLGSKAFERVKIGPSHTHMVIPTKKALILPQKPIPIQPQRPAQQPILGMLVQTAVLQQSTSMQPVLTPANTVAHTRSSPQQLIPQVHPAQVLQTLLNQLAISSQLNLQQSASSACQPIGQTPPVASQPNAQGSSRAGTLMAQNPHPRTSENSLWRLHQLNASN